MGYMNSGGILALNDFLPDCNRWAAEAIKEFLQQDLDFEEWVRSNQQLIRKK